MASINEQQALTIIEGISAYLIENPGDYAGAGSKYGIPREKVIDLLAKYPAMFADADDKYFDKLNYLMRLSALGKKMPEGHENFNFNQAKTLLLWRQKEVKEFQKINKAEAKSPEAEAIENNFLEKSQLLEEHLLKIKLLTNSEHEDGEDGKETTSTIPTDYGIGDKDGDTF